MTGRNDRASSKATTYMHVSISRVSTDKINYNKSKRTTRVEYLTKLIKQEIFAWIEKNSKFTFYRYLYTHHCL